MRSTRLGRYSWLFVWLVACGGSEEAGPSGWSVGAGSLATLSGKAFRFGPTGELDLRGARVAVAEAPEQTTTLADDDTFTLQVPSGAPVSLRLEQPGFMPTQTAALPIGPLGMDLIGFQVPTLEMADLLASFVGSPRDPGLCQIASTVSRKDTEPYGGAALGEPGVVVAIDPPLPTRHGPVYFEYVNHELIYPDRKLTSTTLDGGVLFVNVPPGEYTLTATKAGKQFTSVKVRCAAGLLVNAAPPRGLQEL